MQAVAIRFSITSVRTWASSTVIRMFFGITKDMEHTCRKESPRGPFMNTSAAVPDASTAKEESSWDLGMFPSSAASSSFFWDGSWVLSCPFSFSAIRESLAVLGS